MGASLYRVSYDNINDMGRAEANWLMNHVGTSDERPNTVSVAREQLEEYIQGAEECEGCEYFENNEGIKLHAEVTKEMRAKLTALWDLAKDDYVDIEISW